jgi:hypothetical protein
MTPPDPMITFCFGIIFGIAGGWLSAILYDMYKCDKAFDETRKERETERHTKELIRNEIMKAFELKAIQDARWANLKKEEDAMKDEKRSV